MISGFTIVRNARVLDYPFRESVLSALPLCGEFVINCGDSDDDTLEICKDLERHSPDKIRLLSSEWKRDGQAGGFQLRYQTNAALAACTGTWCLYLQSDEVLHEEDYPRIEAARQLAEKKPEVDGVIFDYLHFYVSYDYVIRGRNWYRREVRLFKNGRGIESHRDAQGFRRAGERLSAIASGARVFHYGYVRPPKSLRTKSIEMSQWWGEKPSLKESSVTPVRHVGLSLFNQSHPPLMRNRIAKYDFPFDPRRYKRKWDKNELKNALTLVWETFFPFRIGEFRNYELIKD